MVRVARGIIVGTTLGLAVVSVVALAFAVVQLPDPTALLTLRAFFVVGLAGVAAFTSHPFGAIALVLLSVAVLWSFASASGVSGGRRSCAGRSAGC